MMKAVHLESILKVCIKKAENQSQQLMRPEGIEPPFQEPESYVRSITLRAPKQHIIV